MGLRNETSRGKDTPSGHWEIAGTPVDFDWGYFPETIPAFPAALTEALIAEASSRESSATATPPAPRSSKTSARSIRTGKPICYTSADSVFQIAAHEQVFGLERLYEVAASPGDCAIP